MPLYERVSTDIPVTLKTTSYTIVPDDNCVEIQFESAGAVSADLPSVSAVGNGFNVIIRNVGAGSLTITPSGSDMIDGESTLSLPTGAWRWIRNDGTTWKSISTSAASSGTLNGNLFNSFRVILANNGGTLQHRIVSSVSSGDPSDYTSAINGASDTFQNTPTGPDSTTPMVAGIKRTSPGLAVLYFDTADLTGVVPSTAIVSLVEHNTIGTALNAVTLVESHNVDGVTRARLEVYITNAATGADFGLTTTDIGTGKFMQIAFQGYLPVYS